MKTIDTKDINVNDIFVATYNADAFNVEDANAYDECAQTLSKYNTINVLTAEDGHEFEVWASRLDYSDEMPDEIYVAEDGQFAFTME